LKFHKKPSLPPLPPMLISKRLKPLVSKTDRVGVNYS